MLDFEKGYFSLESTRFCKYERDNDPIVNSTIGLRKCEGILLSSAKKKQPDALLEDNRDIFSTGGGPTAFAMMHRIDPKNTYSTYRLKPLESANTMKIRVPIFSKPKASNRPLQSTLLGLKDCWFAKRA